MHSLIFFEFRTYLFIYADPRVFFFVQHGTNKLHSVGSDHAFHSFNYSLLFSTFSLLVYNNGFFFVQHGTNKLHSVGSDHAFHSFNYSLLFSTFSLLVYNKL